MSAGEYDEGSPPMAPLDDEDGFLTESEAADGLGVEAFVVRAMRGHGLVVVEDPARGPLYPRWQFVRNGSSGWVTYPELRIAHGLCRVLPLLDILSPTAQARFFLTPNHRTGGDRPIDWMRRRLPGDIGTVERAAVAFARSRPHGAGRP